MLGFESELRNMKSLSIRAFRAGVADKAMTAAIAAMAGRSV